jgi:hypothetical protein
MTGQQLYLLYHLASLLLFVVSGVNMLSVWIITNMMHCFSSAYWVITPLHVLGTSAAHHQEVECINVVNGTCYTSEMTVSGPGRQSIIQHNKYHWPHIQYTFYLLMMGYWCAQNMWRCDKSIGGRKTVHRVGHYSYNSRPMVYLT